MVKYVLLSLGVVGLLMLGQGLGLQSSWPTSQQERFVARVPEEFATIQAAIDAVAEGGTVLIGPGLYKENIQITKSIRLVGAGQEHVQLRDKDPTYPIISIRPRAPIQIYIQDLTILGNPIPSPKPSLKGLHIFAPAQVILRRVTMGELVTGATALMGSFPFLLSQIILEEVQVVRNVIGLEMLGAELLVSRSKIEGNLLFGIYSDERLSLSESLIIGNQLIGIFLGSSSDGLNRGPQPMGYILDNEFKQNGVGIVLASETEGSWVVMSHNSFVQNQRYGLALLDPDCPMEEPLESPSRKGATINFFGWNNEFRDNVQDLCPPDYPWPPGFRK